MTRLGRLLRGIRRERRAIAELRPRLGWRRALAYRARIGLGVEDTLIRHEGATMMVAEHEHRLRSQQQLLDVVPAIGRALEGLAARVDAHDVALADPAEDGLDDPTGPRLPPASQIMLPPRRAPKVPDVEPAADRLRILGVTGMYPLVSETYMDEEMGALRTLGAELSWYRLQTGPAVMHVREPVFEDLDTALELARPHVAIVYWLSLIEHVLPRLEAAGLPFAVRVHSFDFDRELVARTLEHPLCAAVWIYPNQDPVPGAHFLAPLFTSLDRLAPAGPREIVLSASAGLPKKDWPLLLDAFDRVLGADRRIITGVTNDHEHVPYQLSEACERLANPPLLQVNLTREQVLGLLPRTAVVVYTLVPEAPFAMPMSIVDALCAGCAVIVPDRPEATAFAGPHARSYRTAEDIARHVREVLAGGPDIEAEWEANQADGRARFADPQRSTQFMSELCAGIERVRPGSLPDGVAQTRA